MSDLCKEFNKALSNTQKQKVPWIRDTLTCNSVSNSNQELIQQQLEKKNIFKKKVLAKKNTLKFTMFRHYLILKDIIENNANL